MNESILSKETLQEQGMLKHNGWRLVQCEGSVGWWEMTVITSECFYIALYGLPVLRPAEKVTGSWLGLSSDTMTMFGKSAITR